MEINIQTGWVKMPIIDVQIALSNGIDVHLENVSTQGYGSMDAIVNREA